MARVLNIEIPDNKQVKYSLTYIYGIGLWRSSQILLTAKVKEEKRVKDLTDKELTAIRDAASSFTTEGDLRREEQYSIKRLMEIGCYRGVRHRKKMPVRGQRTKNNTRTRKGAKKTIANKKKAPTH